MDVRRAAGDLRKIVESAPFEKWLSAPETKADQCHLLWMLDGIILNYVQYEKAHRWLGYVQGVICAYGITTVEEMKQLNKAS